MNKNLKPGIEAAKKKTVKHNPKSRPRNAVVRPVSQVVLSFPNKKKDEFEKIRTACLNWIADRAGRPIPTSAWAGNPFELEDIGAQRVGATGISAPKYWAAHLDDADKNVPQRVWVTEIGIGQAKNNVVLFGVRLVCVTRGDDAPFERSIPGFVRPLITTGGALLDGQLIRQEPWFVSTQEDVDNLIDLLSSPSREADVIVLSLPEGSSDPAETIIPALEIHQKTLGAAHVVIISSPASFLLSEFVGREFSVFRQAVRTYVSGFDFQLNEPYKHPLSLPARIMAWPDGGPQGYGKMLVSKALARSVAKADHERLLPSFSTIRRIAAEQQIKAARKRGSSDTELLKLAEDEIRQLNKAIEDERNNNNALLETADQEREEAVQASLQAKSRTELLLRRIDLLETRLRLSGNEAAIPIPDDLEFFQMWCEKYLSGGVEIHHRAYQGVKKSQYNDPRLLYKALLALRDYYVPMRRNGGSDLREGFDKACQELGIDEAATFSGNRWGEEGDTYFVNFAGKKRLLDRHLKRGVTKDERHCFRLYFFWDDETEQVVVGWLPSHLDTRQT